MTAKCNPFFSRRCADGIEQKPIPVDKFKEYWAAILPPNG
jgi:hypothetical protein